DEKFFVEIGTGYRAKYLVKIINELKDIDFSDLKLMDTIKLKNKLISLSGVGPKVADCIMLFCLEKKDVFPVDTWIEKVYNDYFEKENNRIRIREILIDKFGGLSGYAQQYLFYYKREKNI
ncbi:MAG: 8-oxoguanine DNA glycosylase, partial [Clostridia bacterium]|nr:8-oxoguanine DNA glycosylase [Clostridia bacterium]